MLEEWSHSGRKPFKRRFHVFSHFGTYGVWAILRLVLRLGLRLDLLLGLDLQLRLGSG